MEKFDEEEKKDTNNGQKNKKETMNKEESCLKKPEMMKYSRSVSCNHLLNPATTQASLFTSPEVQYKVIDLVSPPNNTEKKIKSHFFSTAERKTSGRQLTLDYKKNQNGEMLEGLMFGLKRKVSMFFS